MNTTMLPLSKASLGLLGRELLNVFLRSSIFIMTTVNSPAFLGLNTREMSRYSLIRAIDAMAREERARAPFEFELSDAVAKRLNRSAVGLFVPYDWQAQSLQEMRPAEARALATSSNAAGGYTVPTNVMATDFITALTNRMVTAQAGATMLTDLVGNISIPKETTPLTPNWIAEGGNFTEGDQQFAVVLMSPKTVTANVDLTRRLANQTSLAVEAFYRDSLTRTLARAIDKASIHGGDGSNEPTGILNTVGIGDVAGGTNGAAPTFDHMLALENILALANADDGPLAYVTNGKGRNKLKGTPIVAGYPSKVWQNNQMNGYPAYASNQVRSNLTKGTSSGVCSAVVFGNWADLLVGMWGVLDLFIDPYTLRQDQIIRVSATQDADIALRHVESFAAMKDALTT